MPLLSPQNKEKFLKFRRNKKAFYSLILLTSMFLLSLPAELFFNDKPLAMKVDGKWFFPVFKKYSMKDFGGESAIPITNYSSKSFMDFLNGVEKKTTVKIDDLFGEEDDDDDLDEDLGEEEETEKKEEQVSEDSQKSTKKDYWILRALVEYDYKANTENPKSGRKVLASPSEEFVAYENKTYKSSWLDHHYLGTDKEGKDVLARLVYGFRVSMLFGLGLAISGTVLGCILGAVQGYFGGLTDLLGQRLSEIWGSMPRLYLLIILSSFLANVGDLTETQHYLMLFLILNLTAWMGMSTYMRAEFLKARNLEYVKAAKALGASSFTIMRRHILPNSLTPIITFFPFAITSGILALVSLDFLALGVKYPAPSLGDLLSQGQQNLHATWIILPTFIVLTVTLTLLNFIGEGIRNAFDPRAK